MLGHNSGHVKDSDIENAVDFYRNLESVYKPLKIESTKAKAYKEIALKRLALSAPGKSYTEKEANAMTTDEYQAAVNIHAVADAELESFELMFKAHEALRSIWQTQNANLRGK